MKELSYIQEIYGNTEEPSIPQKDLSNATCVPLRQHKVGILKGTWHVMILKGKNNIPVKNVRILLRQKLLSENILRSVLVTK